MVNKKKKSDNKVLAIIGLVLNVVVLPGLGSIVGGRIKTGIIQLALFLISIPLMLILIGFVTAFAVWIWGLVTGIQMIQEG